jgi:6-phosphogluconolactonase
MDKYIGYIGTNASGAEGGIRVVEADAKTGALKLVQQLKDFDSPSYFAIRKDKKLMASCRSNPDTGHPNKGMAATLRINGDGTLSPAAAMPSVSASGPCHLCFSPDGRFIYAAHYGEGRATVYSVEPEGGLWGPVQVIQHTGSGPSPQQGVPHAHYCYPTPDGAFICYVDLGLDVVRLYRPDGNGILSFEKDVPVVRGAGARHLVFSRDGKFCWVVSELGSLLTSFAYQDGEFTLLETADTLEAGFQGVRSSSAVRLSPDGRLLFVGNRGGSNSVAVFKVNGDGTAALSATVPCPFPRDLNLLPNGDFLYVCGQDEGVVAVFRVDYDACTLRPCGESFAVPKSTCVEFL